MGYVWSGVKMDRRKRKETTRTAKKEKNGLWTEWYENGQKKTQRETTRIVMIFKRFK